MSLPTTDRMSGKSGYIRFISPANVRTLIPFYSWEAEVETTFQDVTGSMNYDKSRGLVYAASAPVSQSLTAEIRGRYWRNNTPSYVLRQLYDGLSPLHVELGFSPLDPFVDFYAWVENFRARNPLDDIVDFTCSLRSEGTVTDLANLVAGPLDFAMDGGG